MVAAQEELVRPRVMALIDDLVAREASGVLEVTGNPSGVIYLDGGRIAYARASWVPGLAVRLRAITPSLVAAGEPRPGEDADDAGLAGLVVQHGYLTTAGLHELIGSVVAEAFLVLTIPLAADSPVAAIRFTPIPTHWTDLFPRLGLDEVRAEAARCAERMAASGLAPTTPVAPRDLAAPITVLTREQWAVACQIGDRASARELAMRRGASLSDTVHCLGSLVAAGLCVPVQGGGRGQRAAARGPVPSGGVPSGQVPAGQVAATTPSLGFPVDQRMPVRAMQEAMWPRQAARPGQPPSVEVLRQVLDGLRRLT